MHGRPEIYNLLNGCILISIHCIHTLRFCEGQCALSYRVGIMLLQYLGNRALHDLSSNKS